MLFVSAAGARAQSVRPTLTGHVRDQNKAAVRGARVRLRQEGTKVEFVATTDDEGAFIFGGLAQGRYSLSAMGEGFSATAQEVTLDGGGSRDIEVLLRPGALAEEVVVSSSRIASTPEVLEQIPGSVEI
ncbi:MAG: carboxypeptidase-like regulatory domain-containing protein, partial [Acidobacteria bacterium]|nr:carboxypeptidase-like regulatory domain-containing protein [Acidobacteriota bacterium]